MLEQVKATFIFILMFSVAAQEDNSCTNAEDCARSTDAEDVLDAIALLQSGRALEPAPRESRPRPRADRDDPDVPQGSPGHPGSEISALAKVRNDRIKLMEEKGSKLNDPDAPEGHPGHPGSEISALAKVEKDRIKLVEEKGSKMKGKAPDWQDEPDADQENEDDDTNERKLPIPWLSKLEPLNVSERNFILDKLQVNASEAEKFFSFSLMAKKTDHVTSDTASGGSYYPTAVPIKYTDGSTSVENYCPKSQRATLWGGQEITADGCYILSSTPVFYGNYCGPYFYTSATPNDASSFAVCKCCLPWSPTFYKSSQGNRVYYTGR